MNTRTAFLPALTLALVGGCDQPNYMPNGLTDVESLAVTLVSPPLGMRGTADNPLMNTHDVAINVQAIDGLKNPYTKSISVDVYISYGGQKIGTIDPCGKNESTTALTTLTLDATGKFNSKGLNNTGCSTDKDCGAGTHCVNTMCMIHLDKAYGSATLWLQQHPDASGVSHGFGASDAMVFPNPTIPEIQTPADLAATTATYCTPFNNAQVDIVSATGNTGQLVVTSVFSSAYVVCDTGAPMVTTNGVDSGGFNCLYVYTFGQPPFFVTPGRLMASLTGDISKFVGFSELNFPTQNPISSMEPVTVPDPYLLGAADQPAGNASMIHLLRMAGSTVKITGQVCPIDQTTTTGKDWVQYNTFQLQQFDSTGKPTSAGCVVFNTFGIALPQKTLGTLDPIKCMPKSVTGNGCNITVTGMLKNSSGQNDDLGTTGKATVCRSPSDCVAAGLAASDPCVEGTCKNGVYNFWTIVPRTADDIVINKMN